MGGSCVVAGRWMCNECGRAGGWMGKAVGVDRLDVGAGGRV